MGPPGTARVEVDLTDTRATAEAADTVAKRFAVSHFIHSAGAIRADLLADVRQNDLQELSQLHLGAAVLIVQAVLPGMRQSAFGRIVLISSRAALGLQARTAYAATKAGMIGMARTWRSNWRRSGSPSTWWRRAPSRTPKCFGGHSAGGSS